MKPENVLKYCNETRIGICLFLANMLQVILEAAGKPFYGNALLQIAPIHFPYFPYLHATLNQSLIFNSLVHFHFHFSGLPTITFHVLVHFHFFLPVSLSLLSQSILLRLVDKKIHFDSKIPIDIVFYLSLVLNFTNHNFSYFSFF